jgi:hypothetical protein
VLALVSMLVGPAPEPAAPAAEAEEPREAAAPAAR